MATRKLRKAFKTFHGRDPRFRKRIRFTVPKKGLVILGEVHAIEYVSDKLHGGGDGKRAIYRHEFETPVILCADEKMKRQLYVIGDDVIITEAGIEN